jgi:hypothetical protein
MAVRVLGPRAIAGGFFIALWCAGAAAAVTHAVADPVPDLRHPAVTLSAGLTVKWMLAAWFLMSALPREVMLARLAWTLGLLMLFAHLGLAFGVAHGWSHAAAVEHVREAGGPGAAIAVSYLFAAVWLADVAWWWGNPAGHAARPRRVGWAIHGFLAFVVVNATVVFGPADRRWLYAAGLGAVGVLAALRSAGRRAAGRASGDDCHDRFG